MFYTKNQFKVRILFRSCRLISVGNSVEGIAQRHPCHRNIDVCCPLEHTSVSSELSIGQDYDAMLYERSLPTSFIT